MGYWVIVLVFFQKKFAKADTRLDIIQFSHGYGKGWADIDIMRRGGIPVTSSSSYEGLFRMAAENRIDLFCRGANEVYKEVQNNSDVVNLAYDKSKAFYYNFPHFFFTHKSNKELIQRLTRGFEIVLQDGSMLKLWHQHFDQSLNFIKLEERKIFYFDNPFIKGLDPSYQQYLYFPENLKASFLKQ